jgi:uncharacterized membrane protein YidH (DUF202 family)
MNGEPQPGTARERTRLAWRRTALAATAVTLLFARPTVDTGRPWLVVLAVPSWLVVLALAGPARLTVPGARLLSLALIGYALFGAALVVLP